MDDQTYLLGKLAALESALQAAISTHSEPAKFSAALAQAMSSYTPEHCPRDVRAFAEGWMAVVTPLLTDQACRAAGPEYHEYADGVCTTSNVDSESR